jgi:hypothetical protein
MSAMIKSTPFKLFSEIASCSPSQLWQLLTRPSISISSDTEVLDLMEKGYSFVRWGDGETAFVRGKFNWYQEFNSDLRKKLLDLLSTFSSNLILGIHWGVYAKINDKRWGLRIFKIIFSTRVFIIKKLNSQRAYQKFATLDFWWRNADQIKDILARVSINRQCILIASNVKYLDFCPINTKFIAAPASNAFTVYEKIIQEIDAHLEAGGNKTVILTAIGPTSKALVFDYYLKTQILDIGHGFNFALNGKNSWAWKNK